MQKGFILSLVFAAIIAVFALNNSGKVLIDLFFTEIEMSQAIIIFISALLGAVIVAILGWVKSFKVKKESKDCHKEVNKIEEDNKELRNLLTAKELELKIKEEELLAKEEEIKTLTSNFVEKSTVTEEINNNN